MANTFKFGNGNWAVKDGAALAYNDENGNFKPLPFDFTRASSATRVNKDGLIETVPSGKPRIDFTDNTSGHLLLEPSRENKFPYSNQKVSGGLETFTAGTNTISITNDYGISPDGTQNAMRMVATCGSTSSDRAGFRDAISMSASSATLSFYAKSNTSSSQIIAVHFNGTNKQTITVTTEWQRFTYTDTSVTTNNAGVEIRGGSTDTDVDVLLFGFQMEQASYATSYIPTEGSAVTRSADKCFQGGLTDKGILNNSAITIYLETDIQSDTSTNYQEIIALYNDANNVNLRLETRTNNQLYVQHSGVYISGSNFNNLSLGSNSINLKKIAIYLTTTQFKIFADGSQLYSTLNGTYNLDFDRIGFRVYNNFVETLIKNKEIKLYNTALSDSELQALTSG